MFEYLIFKWFSGTKVYEKLQGILMNTQTKKNIPMLSPHQQTSSLEGFHSVINHFAPKMFFLSRNDFQVY